MCVCVCVCVCVCSQTPCLRHCVYHCGGVDVTVRCHAGLGVIVCITIVVLNHYLSS